MTEAENKQEIRDHKISMDDSCITLKKLFGRAEKLDYGDIDHAYIRVEEVNAKMCCGRANFDLIYLMLSDGKEAQPVKIQITSMEKGRAMLEMIRQHNPRAKIGFRGEAGADPSPAV